jgi:L-ascorbate metabolism protein UlaG (beta-lactamase superfamily)
MEYLFTSSNATPQSDILVEKIDSLNLAHFKDSTRLIWFGHSTFLLQLQNQNILIDPMFSKVAAPYSWLGSNRFSKELPIEIEKMPRIDAVILSHDHYDHLDYESILKLKNKVKIFYTPLGVGVHLVKWGIEKERVVKYYWWEEVSSNRLTFKCTAFQHFLVKMLKISGSTLWSSYVIQSQT